jgi:ABC-type nickel/cobalt efflux system permease component RcnA
MGSEYPDDWDTIRRRVYRSDGYTCQNCGKTGGPKGNAELHAHHITPRSQGGSDRPENLTTLCQACHSQTHGRRVGSTEGRTSDTSKTDEGVDLGTRIVGAILALLITPVISLVAGILGYTQIAEHSIGLAILIAAAFLAFFTDI